MEEKKEEMVKLQRRLVAIQQSLVQSNDRLETIWDDLSRLRKEQLESLSEKKSPEDQHGPSNEA